MNNQNINPVLIAIQMPWQPAGHYTLVPVVGGVAWLETGVWFSCN